MRVELPASPAMPPGLARGLGSQAGQAPVPDVLAGSVDVLSR